MCDKPRKIISCHRPDICGRKLAGCISTAEVIDKEVVGSVMTVGNSLVFLRKPGGRLNRSGHSEAEAISNFLNSLAVIRLNHIASFLRHKLLGYISHCNVMRVILSVL